MYSKKLFENVDISKRLISKAIENSTKDIKFYTSVAHKAPFLKDASAPIVPNNKLPPDIVTLISPSESRFDVSYCTPALGAMVHLFWTLIL